MQRFLPYWLAQSCTIFSNNFPVIAIVYWVVTRPEQLGMPAATALALFSLAGGPGLFVSLPVSQLIDRLPRKPVIVGLNLLQALFTLVVGLILAAGGPFLAILLCYVVLSLVSTLDAITFDTTTPRLVDDGLLPRANSMVQSTHSVSMIAGPALGAVVVSMNPGWLQAAAERISGQLVADGIVLAYLIHVVLLLVTAAWISTLTIPDIEPVAGDAPDEDETGTWRDRLLVGFRVIAANRTLLSLLLLFGIGNIGAAPFQTLLPVLLEERHTVQLEGIGIGLAGGIAAANSISAGGALIGALLITILITRITNYRVTIGVVFLVGAFLTLSAMITMNTIHLFVVIAVTSLMRTLPNAIAQTIWQRSTPKHQMAQVFAVRRLVATGTGLVGGLAAGFLAPITSVVFVIVAGSVLVIGWTVIVILPRSPLRIEA